MEKRTMLNNANKTIEATVAVVLATESDESIAVARIATEYGVAPDSLQEAVAFFRTVLERLPFRVPEAGCLMFGGIPFRVPE